MFKYAINGDLMNNKKMIIIAGIIVAIAVVAAFMLFSSGEDAGYSKIDILGNGSVPENGTLNVKLENGQNIALKDKNVTIVIKNSKGKVVFNKTAKTYVNGVANVKLTNLGAGEYDVNATFGGDENYTSSSVSEKIKITKTESEEEPTDTASDDTATVESSPAQSTPSSSSSSYQSQSYTPTTSDDDGGDAYYDEDGNQIDVVIDEDGNEVIE